MLDTAFTALKTFDWGQDLKTLKPIDDAVVSTYGDDAARKDLEDRLTAALKEAETYDAKQYICRHLMTIGTASCVPTVAALLTDEKLSHMGRYALERIPADEAAAALRTALGTVGGKLKVGMIASLGVRKDSASVPLLGALLADSDPAVAVAAATALGDIGSPEAVAALTSGKPSEEAQFATADAKLACAETLLAEGKNKEALVIYKSLIGAGQAKQVKLAATRGMLACAGKN